MEMNSVLFPAPKSTYTITDPIARDLVFIPRNFKKIMKQQMMEELKSMQDQQSPRDYQPDDDQINVIQDDFIKTQIYSKMPNKKCVSVFDTLEMRKHRLGEFTDRFYQTQNSKANNADELFNDTESLSRFNSNTLEDDNDRTQSFNNLKNKEKQQKLMDHIPCLYLPFDHGSSKILLYFHGNAEDIGLSRPFLDYIRQLNRMHVMAVEYVGYGIYQGDVDANQVMFDAETVLEFLIKYQQIDPQQIVLCGRSIGSGPATYLASKYLVSCLMLIAPFTSIRDMAKQISGRVFQYFITDRFRNKDYIKRVKCPTFILHGQKDTLIPLKQSEYLHFKCGGPCALVTPREMDHNQFDIINDLIIPFNTFMKKAGISNSYSTNLQGFNKDGVVQFDQAFKEIPQEFEKVQATKSSIWNWIIRKLQK
ncbi:UNKNOWN [Stylonychia lemnae]|uniref:Serine aminopeptidase S33 domain-containing protein n=1 Tax=Stylonychia lemnae TaxID=5949 RepID=A0A078B534_STYLE|nr:UNKNOWN [Stylonychia lemnae]|eukprot:CDW88352.1 UNKNOWN [Stylonychia lemnae]